MFTSGGKHSGFTVIEVLIGIGLFGLVMPTIIVATVQIARLNDRAADLTRASVVAEDKIEVLRSSGYNTLTDGTTDFTAELDPSFGTPRSATYTVSAASPGLKNVEVRIEYTDQGTLRELDFATQMAELGVAQ